MLSYNQIVELSHWYFIVLKKKNVLEKICLSVYYWKATRIALLKVYAFRNALP